MISQPDVKEGSPPRVRGRAMDRAEPANGSGITPARAGKRAGAAAISMASEDHPRACGEELQTQENRITRGGSPPRVRGRDVLHRGLV